MPTTTRTAPVLALALAACGSGAATTTRWTGPLTPTAPDPACAPSRAVAQIHGNHVLFAPDEGTWVLDGTLAPSGAIAAERSRPGASKQPYNTRLAAILAPSGITGTYTTPRCTYRVELAPT